VNRKFVQKNEKHGGGRGTESAGYVGSMAGRLLPHAQHGLHVSRLLADARHQLHRYKSQASLQGKGGRRGGAICPPPLNSRLSENWQFSTDKSSCLRKSEREG